MHKELVKSSVPPVESPHLIVESPSEVHGEHALADGQLPVESDDQDLILLELRHICRHQVLQQPKLSPIIAARRDPIDRRSA